MSTRKPKFNVGDRVYVTRGFEVYAGVDEGYGTITYSRDINHDIYVRMDVDDSKWWYRTKFAYARKPKPLAYANS